MPNMSYCRFENTYNDFLDCINNIHNEAESPRDERYRKKLLGLIIEMSEDIDNLKEIINYETTN
jgi:hypothetical protein